MDIKAPRNNATSLICKVLNVEPITVIFPSLMLLYPVFKTVVLPNCYKDWKSKLAEAVDRFRET